MTLEKMQFIPFYGAFILVCSNIRTMQAIRDINALPAAYRQIDGLEISFSRYTRESFDGVFAIITSENTPGEMMPSVEHLSGMGPEINPQNWFLIAKVREQREVRYIIGTNNAIEKANIARTMWRNEPRWMDGIHNYRAQLAHRRWDNFLLREWGKFIDISCAELSLVYREQGTGVLKRENESQYFGPTARKNPDSLLMAPRYRRY